jgi:hypothetical protein
MKNTNLKVSLTALTMLAAAAFLAPDTAQAHCDTLDGPVVLTAKAALEKGDITPVLKWVKAENEAEIRAAFKKTLAVRSKGAEAKELADQYFFETLVRVHRAGEGAPFDGLKPAGTVEPAVAAADQALATSKVDDLVGDVTKAVANGIRQRFNKAVAAKKYADESVEAGRKYVEAYVSYIHYVEGVYEAAKSAAHGHFPEVETHAGHHD